MMRLSINIYGNMLVYKNPDKYEVKVKNKNAEVAELVDAHDSKSCGVTHESSILSLGTKRKILIIFPV